MNVYLVSSPEGKLTFHEATEADWALKEAIGLDNINPDESYGYGWTVYQLPAITVKECDRWCYE